MIHLPFDDGHFACQEYDFPWPYELELGYRGRKGVPGFDVSVPYEEMSMVDIYASGTEVNRVAEESCHLWMWTTDAFEGHCIDLMSAWGFPKVRTYIWIKTTDGLKRSHKGLEIFTAAEVRLIEKGMRALGIPGKPYAKTGYWGKLGHELLMLGTNDRSYRIKNGTSEYSFFHAPVPKGKHSAKPPEAYELIRRNSPGPRLSAFQRTPRESFIGWGDQYPRRQLDACSS